MTRIVRIEVFWGIGSGDEAMTDTISSMLLPPNWWPKMPDALVSAGLALGAILFVAGLIITIWAFRSKRKTQNPMIAADALITGGYRMAQTPEGRRKLKVKKWLTEIGAYWFMPVQTGWGKKSLDFLVCYNGHFFAVETKGVERAFKPHQALIAEEIGKAGGVAFLVLDDESLNRAKTYVELYMRQVYRDNSRAVITA